MVYCWFSAGCSKTSIYAEFIQKWSCIIQCGVGHLIWAIIQANEPRSLQRPKHIQRRYNLIREIIERRDVKICRVPTSDNVADLLTKALSQKKHDGHTRSSASGRLLL